jgi:tetratricopeptide (TPR) repeat protein
LAAGSSPLSDRLALNIGALSAIGAYLVHSMVDFNMHVPANALLIAFVFGILGDPGTPLGVEIPRTNLSVAPGVAAAVLGAILLIQSARLLPGEYFAERARVTLEGEDPGGAVAEAKKALTYEQKNPDIYFYLGRGLEALGDEQRQPDNRNSYYDAAIAAFDKAHHLAPLEGSYPLDMAFVYDAMARFSEAEWMYDVARSRDPRSVMLANMYQMHLDTWRNGGSRTTAAGPDNSTP